MKLTSTNNMRYTETRINARARIASEMEWQVEIIVHTILQSEKEKEKNKSKKDRTDRNDTCICK